MGCTGSLVELSGSLTHTCCRGLRHVPTAKTKQVKRRVPRQVYSPCVWHTHVDHQMYMHTHCLADMHGDTKSYLYAWPSCLQMINGMLTQRPAFADPNARPGNQQHAPTSASETHDRQQATTPTTSKNTKQHKQRATNNL